MCAVVSCLGFFFFFKQKTAYEMRISDWSSDVCSSDLLINPLLSICGVKRMALQCLVTTLPGTLEESVLPVSSGVSKAKGRKSRANSKTPEIGRASCRERVCQYV